MKAIMARGKQASMGVVVSFIVVALIMCIPHASVVAHATDVPDECAERLHAVTEQLHAVTEQLHTVTAVKEAACAAVCYALQVEQSLDSVMMMHVAGCGCGDVLAEDGLSVSVRTGSRRDVEEDHSAATYRRALLQDDFRSVDKVRDCKLCSRKGFTCMVDEFFNNSGSKLRPPCTYDVLGEDEIDYVRGAIQVEGDLRISDMAIENLDFLSALKRVDGSLIIEDNPNLINLDGLQNLVAVGDSLRIQNNENLESLEGLNNLVSVGSYVYWDDDDRGGIYIGNNPSLTSLEGLDSLEYAGTGCSFSPEELADTIPETSAEACAY